MGLLLLLMLLLPFLLLLQTQNLPVVDFFPYECAQAICLDGYCATYRLASTLNCGMRRHSFCSTWAADLRHCLLHWQHYDVVQAASHAFCGICRLQARPGSVTMAQYGKTSHASKPPPPPSFKAPPPLPPGPPPSAVQPASTPAVRSQGISAPAPEPRRNAWEQPLAGHRLSQPLGTLQSAANVESLSSKGRQMLSHQGSHGSALSDNSGNTLGSKSDAHVDFGAATTRGQQGDMAEAAPSSPAQMTEPAGRSSTAASAVLGPQDSSSYDASQYPQEAEHAAQIADLQASTAVSFSDGCAVTSLRHCMNCYTLYDWTIAVLLSVQVSLLSCQDTSLCCGILDGSL